MSRHSRNMLIAYLHCNRGGVCSVIAQRMPPLANAGWKVDTVFKQDYGGRDGLIKAGVRRVQFQQQFFEKETVHLATLGKYSCVVIFDVPELVHPLRTRFNGALIYEIHTSIPRNLLKNSTKVLRLCDAILVPSRWSKELVLNSFPGIPDSLVYVVPDIVDETVFNVNGPYRQGMDKTLLWVGKIDDFKKWEEATRIGVTFLKEHKERRFVMMTGGSYPEERVKRLLDYISDDDICRRFAWIRNLDLVDMACLYRSVAVGGGMLLATSLGESFGLSIHEAMRCGLPVVSTNVGAVPEVVENGVSGLLYEPGDIETAIKHLQEIADDSALRSKLKDGALRRLEPYSAAHLSSKYISVLDQICAR